MAPERENVKLWPAILKWIDAHPRTGWYVAGMVTFNFLLNLADAFDVDLGHLFSVIAHFLPF